MIFILVLRKELSWWKFEYSDKYGRLCRNISEFVMLFFRSGDGKEFTVGILQQKMERERFDWSRDPFLILIDWWLQPVTGLVLQQNVGNDKMKQLSVCQIGLHNWHLDYSRSVSHKISPKPNPVIIVLLHCLTENHSHHVNENLLQVWSRKRKHQ